MLEGDFLNKILFDYLQSQDYNSITDGCIQWIRQWFAENGPSSPAVIGISGGKDSTVVSALCVEALGKDRVFGVLMPNGVQPDIDYSIGVVDHLGIKSAVVNIKDAYEGERLAIEAGLPEYPLSSQALINLAPRIRMATLYAVSQCMNGRVSNNSNRSERYVGYSTIFGDSVGDFSPLLHLTATEVRLVGKLLGIPDRYIEKPPSDGLSSRTDEDAFGFSYEALDTYILTGQCSDEEILARIDRRHQANLFKLKPMPSYSFQEEER